MKANDFFKKHGCEKASRVLSMIGDYDYFKASFRGNNTKVVCSEDLLSGYVSTRDLKRLVESHELIKETGMSISEIKEHIGKYPQIIEFNFEDFGKILTGEQMLKAIADVESCQ